MNAREMFEKLGYEFKEIFYDDESNYTYEYSCGGKRFIFQNIDEKGIVTDSVKYICSDELKAIIQQINELGWYGEEQATTQEIKKETNFEHFEDEIREVNFDFAVRDGKVIPCKSAYCNECHFNGNSTSCYALKVEWLYQPYTKIKYTLTEPEYNILKVVQMAKRIEPSDYHRLLLCFKQKGYFKKIPIADPIEDILEHSEVIK